MKSIVISIFVLLLGCSDTTKVEKMCNELIDDYKGLQMQLPIQSDITTKIVGINAFYLPSKNECFSTLTAFVDVSAFINAVSKNDIKKQQELSTFFKSELGKSKLIEIINIKFNKKKETNEFPTQMKGFTFKEIYKVSDTSMEKIILEHKY